jgi:acyl-CoA thioester hydrolase
VIKTFAGIAHPWLCDIMGHLNTRNYVAMFDDASFVVLARLGYLFREAPFTQLGWADVRNEIDYLAEVPLGTIVEIYSGIAKLGTKSITVVSEMRSAETTLVHARMKAVLVYFDRQAKKSVPLTEEIRRAAAALLLDPVDGAA